MLFFFFNDTATTEIYTLSLHDALPIFDPRTGTCLLWVSTPGDSRGAEDLGTGSAAVTATSAEEDGRGEASSNPCRSEEHTSELQSRQYLVCRLLLENKKNTSNT